MKSSPRCFTRLSKRPARLFAALTAFLLLSALASLCLGTVFLSPVKIIQALASGGGAYARVLLYARLPRTAGCVLAGAALAVSGAVIQSVLANPLAAPNIIGVNAGAGAAVTLCCAFFPTAAGALPLAAFAGALAAVLVVFLLSERVGASRLTLVLAGVTISAICGALTDFTVSFVPNALVGYSDFRIGGLAGVSLQKIFPAACVIVPCLALACTLTSELDVLSLGSETAAGLGVRVRFTRILLLALAAALAGSAVSFAGLIGFVGLIIPHLVRRLFGGENRLVVPASMLCGAAILTLCDIAARTIFAPYELSVGILLAFLGGPFFLWLLLRRRGGRTNDRV